MVKIYYLKTLNYCRLRNVLISNYLKNIYNYTFLILHIFAHLVDSSVITMILYSQSFLQNKLNIDKTVQTSGSQLGSLKNDVKSSTIRQKNKH